MKSLNLILLFVSFASNVIANNTDSLLQGYLDKKEYFKLNRFLTKHLSACSDFSVSYYSAFTANAFNRLQESNLIITKVSRKYGNRLTQPMRIALLKTSIDNSIKLFSYKAAAVQIQQLLSKYAKQIDSTEIEEWKNELQIFKLLQNTAPQSITISNDFTLAYKRDISNLIKIPVTTGQGVDDFIFDTGANLSAVSETFSKKLGLRVFAPTIKVSSFTGEKINARVGVAAKLIIGGAEMHNVVFIVLPDKSLTFEITPTNKYIINGVIGYPVISQLQELQFLPGNKLFIPKLPQQRNESNLALSGLLPVIELIINKTDTLNFHFDTGAGQTIFYNNYYKLKKNVIDSIGVYNVTKIAGAGSMMEKVTYTIPKISFSVQSNVAEFKNITVMTDDTEEFYGNIGQDFIRQFSKMTINFKSMFIDFQK